MQADARVLNFTANAATTNATCTLTDGSSTLNTETVTIAGGASGGEGQIALEGETGSSSGTVKLSCSASTTPVTFDNLHIQAVSVGATH